MNATPTIAKEETLAEPAAQAAAYWIVNANELWSHRRTLLIAGAVALLVSAAIAFSIPKRYESTARLMPPEQPGSSSAMVAALAGRSLGNLGGLGSLAGFLGAKSSGALFIDMLRSRTISDRLIDRFDLQRVYGKRYRVDTVKYLAKRTDIAEDKKSGVITVTFVDTDPQRAQAIAQAYIEELNQVVTRSNVSSARQEREFIAQRLVSVQDDLQRAQQALSEFSSVNTTLDIKEQTHAMVDASARLQAEVIAEQSELDSLEQVYGDDNVRVRAARARIGGLQQELTKLNGSSAVAATMDTDSASPYPSLRQLPRLAVPYANLVRTVKIQETVYELLSQQYEMARIEEAKDTPVVSVIDQPLVAEKKSYPPRLILMLALTALTVGTTSLVVLCRAMWRRIGAGDPRRDLAQRIATDLRRAPR